MARFCAAGVLGIAKATKVVAPIEETKDVRSTAFIPSMTSKMAPEATAHWAIQP